jgi:preprotein translocase subunit SecE
VARSTRQQRRRQRRREQQAESAGIAQRARVRQQQVRPAAQPPKTQTGARRVPGGGTKRFIGESWGELKKVEWPGQRQVMTGSVVVIIGCAIVGAYLWVADLGFQPLVKKVFLGE